MPRSTKKEASSGRAWSYILTILITAALVSAGYMIKEQHEEIQDLKGKLSDKHNTDEMQALEESAVLRAPAISDDTTWRPTQEEFFSLSFRLPEGWVAEMTTENSIGMKDESMYNDHAFGLVRYPDISMDEVIAMQGDQFEDREESRKTVMIDDMEALELTVTSKENGWESISTIIALDDGVYLFSNGAFVDGEYEKEYAAILETLRIQESQ